MDMLAPQAAPERSDGLNYAPVSRGVKHVVCRPGEFVFSAAHLDHGHIYGMTAALLEAGGTLRHVFDPSEKAVAAFLEKFPQARAASLDEILADSEVMLVASAAVNCLRGGIGVGIMRAGKDYFCDKPLFTTLDQAAAARAAVRETGRKYLGYFSERLHSECAVKAGELIREGRIGRPVQVIGLGPHRVNIPSRPAWFFDPDKFGGIICDLGSHQIEQFLYFTGAESARISASRVANYRHKRYPGFQDFGDAGLVADNGAVGYFRLDWLTPDALEAWGDGRTFILGTEGYIELRKYTDIGGSRQPDTLFLVNNKVNERMDLRGKTGYPFFGQLILDCLNRTEKAMTQEHIFLASELAVKAQAAAEIVEG
ncbi:MAG: Gfo/Idh/MocA family oxidoreductase [Planctomycetota bacterium]|jgi:predicted dehydrogenase|nr:Gfo/Idh/MocA family oxidoreductase [Planctomycetota bacterium]